MKTSLLVLSFIAALLPVRTARTEGHSCPLGANKAGVCQLHGKVKFVSAFPKYKIKFVTAFPDIKVKMVDAFPDKPGQWQVVDAFPDFTVQVVEAFPGCP